MKILLPNKPFSTCSRVFVCFKQKMDPASAAGRKWKNIREKRKSVQQIHAKEGIYEGGLNVEQFAAGAFPLSFSCLFSLFRKMVPCLLSACLSIPVCTFSLAVFMSFVAFKYLSFTFSRPLATLHSPFNTTLSLSPFNTTLSLTFQHYSVIHLSTLLTLSHLSTHSGHQPAHLK